MEIHILVIKLELQSGKKSIVLVQILMLSEIKKQRHNHIFIVLIEASILEIELINW